MYRFLAAPRWILFHLLVVVLVIAMINLGFWQLRRLDERRAFNATVTEQANRAPVPLDSVLPSAGAPTADELDALDWRPVTARGHYVSDGQLLVVNRSVDGQAGSVVATPLALDDGRVLFVERGFVPLQAEGDVPPAPSGTVDVTGRLRPSETRRRGQISDPASGELTEVHRLDLDRLAAQAPGPVVPMFVELIRSDPPEPAALPAALPLPELSEGPHLGYAVQWFIFSVCAVVGWVLAVRHSINARRAASRRSAAVPAGAGSTTAIDEPAPPAH